MVAVTKQQAVEALIRGAVRALGVDDEVCALTLAGAAEEAMPKAEEGLDAFKIARMFRAHITKSTLQESGHALNVERNWLKHYREGELETMEIDTARAMLLRAVWRYCAVYGLEDADIAFGSIDPIDGGDPA